MLLSVIIPIFNEENTLLEIIDRVRNVDLKKEIVVVDDFSTDRSREILKNISDIRIVHHARNMGKGAAIRTGLGHIKGEVVVIQDGDLEYNPSDFPALLKPILAGEADVVYGSRFLGNVKGMRLQNFLGNKALTLMTRMLYGAQITDMETCYKMMRVSVVSDLTLRANRFDFEPEITAKILKKGVKFREIPISYRGRSHEEGKKIGWKDGLQAIWSLVKYRFQD